MKRLTIVIFVSMIALLPTHNTNSDKVLVKSFIPPKPKVIKTPKEHLMATLLLYNIKFPKIVYAQAILETGHFTSRNCTVNNNLFGISYKGKVRKFKNWVESVKAYKNYVQYKYVAKNHSEEEYYKFLQDIGYAEDTAYVSKLKSIKSKYVNYE